MNYREKRKFQEILVQQKEATDLKIKELTKFVRENLDSWVHNIILLLVLILGLIFAVI